MLFECFPRASVPPLTDRIRNRKKNKIMFQANPGSSGALELKCGRCTFKVGADGDQKLLNITPLVDQKGALSIAPPGPDGCVHLKWTNRESKSVEPDVLIFPNEWKFEPISTGRDGEVVWLLQLAKNKERRHFFWSLEGDKDVAKDKASKLSTYLKDPSSIPPAGGAMGGAMGGAAGGPGGMSQQQLLQMLGGQGGNVDPAMLQQLMGSMGGGGGGGGGGSSAGQSQPPASSPSAATSTASGTGATGATGGAVSGDAMRAALQSMNQGGGGGGGGGSEAADEEDDDDMEAAMLAAAIAASMAPQNNGGSSEGSEKNNDDDDNNQNGE